MANEEDVKNTEQSSGSENDLSGKPNDGAGQGADTSDGAAGKTPQSIPYSRFKEVNDEAKQAKQVVDWYRQNIGDPDDVLEFRKWKQETLSKAKQDESAGDISPEKLAQVRKLMRAADPEYAQMLEDRTTREQERIEAQLDEAEETIRDLAKSAGFPQDEKVVARIAAHIMAEVDADDTLLRQWRSGKTSCLKKAFERYVEEYITPVRKVADRQKSDIADRRKIARLPSLPSGGSASSTKPQPRSAEDRGINKKTHEDAWAVLQDHLNE
jgi:hypothetical protein